MIGFEHNTLTEHAYSVLLNSFIRGDVKPGERLKLEEVAERLGISPTPLRQALARLQAEGIVHSEPRRGLYVVSLTHEDLRDLYETRLLYETFAAEKVAPVIGESQLQNMQRLVEEYAELRSKDVASARLAWVSKDMEFHQYIVDLAGNRMISTSFGKLGIHLQTLLFTMDVERAGGETIRGHREIFQAFASRDATQAKELLKAHILESRDRFLEALSREPSLSSLQDRQGSGKVATEV
jgi:DNA-binding GntR family transcriptional regulator